MWIQAKVLTGDQEGRKIGFPTINLSPSLLPVSTVQGVYRSKIKYRNKDYSGALYFGPRLVLNETHTVLEIHVLNFNSEIYGEIIGFEIGTFIRGIMNFDSFEALQNQIKLDIEKIRSMSKNK
jgi:riboflavin kinase/FMN adenylyltransferase